MVDRVLPIMGTFRRLNNNSILQVHLMTLPKFSVGDTAYYFDLNCRVYDKNSSEYPGPIYREHFREVVITGETRNSWLVGKRKYSKNGLGLYTAQGVDDECWKNVHAYEITRKISHISVSKLKQIAKLIGYEE